MLFVKNTPTTLNNEFMYTADLDYVFSPSPIQPLNSTLDTTFNNTLALNPTILNDEGIDERLTFKYTLPNAKRRGDRQNRQVAIVRRGRLIASASELSLTAL